MLSEEIQHEKINALDAIISGLFINFSPDLDQLILDFLEEADYIIADCRKIPLDLELNLEKLQSKAKAMHRRWLSVVDVRVLTIIENIKYTEL